MYYDTLQNKELFNTSTLPARSAKFFYDSIDSDWPRDFSGQFTSKSATPYEALTDIRTYSKYVRARINALDGDGTLPVSKSDMGARNAFSGTWSIATSVEQLSPYHLHGLQRHVRATHYVPSTNTAIDISTGMVPSEVSSTNKNYLNSEYISAFAALYATQHGPVTVNVTGAATGAALQYNFSPGFVAFSGIGIATKNFESEYRDPVYFTGVNIPSGDAINLPENYLSTFDKIAKYAGHHLRNCTEAYDDLYFGNTEWAGFTGYQTKSAPLSAHGAHFLKDIRNQSIRWGDGTIQTWQNAYAHAIESIKNNLDEVGSDIQRQARMGGIMEPGYIDAVRSFLWLPQHVANQDPLFYPTYSNDVQAHVNVFEDGMDAILRGSLSEDGILIEGGGFKHSIAPFSGQIPSALMEACAEAAKYYDTAGNTTRYNKWLSLAHGVFSNTVSLYSKDGGYPESPIFNTAVAPGDAGSHALYGYLSILDLKSGSFTADELNSITGDITSVY